MANAQVSCLSACLLSARLPVDVYIFGIHLSAIVAGRKLGYN